ncbi:MAG TPA: alkaline phosphatase D family protein [Haliangium sp.]|nr:alkaline phosphatase D family protein [Haliangium sp.]
MRHVLAQASPDNASSVFSLSVASGDPSPTGVVLWTRIDPLAYRADEDLYFEVAQDAAFTLPVFEGLVPAMEIGPQRDYTVKIDLNGQLQVNRLHYYRFVYRGVASRTARCRTTPLPGASMSALKFAVVSCQDYTNGYYSVFNHIATDTSLHYVLHLGDFIYETVGDRRFQPLPFEDRRITLPNGFGEARDLDDYRHLYRTFRSDPYLQSALERHTWIFTTDDHETANNCYWDYERDTLGAPDHPFQKDPDFGNDPALLRMLKLDAQRAWTEYVPARVTINPGATHPHQFLSTHRSFKFGNLVDLFVLDTRTYRTRQPDDNSIFEHFTPENSPGIASTTATMLGQTQREWLYNGLHAANARWQVLGNQTLLSKLTVSVAGQPLFVNSDAWDGYTSERTQLLQQVRNAGIDNFVVLTGDMHSYVASHIEYDFSDGLTPSNVAGVEFMTPSVTSGNISDVLASLDAQSKGSFDTQALTYKQILQALLNGAIYVTNTHLHYFNSYKYGYSTIRFLHDRCEWVGYSVSKSVANGSASRSVVRRASKYTDLPYLVETPTWP